MTFITNSYGETSLPVTPPVSRVRHWLFGEWDVQNTGNGIVHSRGPYTNNPKRSINGSPKFWRNPSSYHRAQFQYSPGAVGGSAANGYSWAAEPILLDWMAFAHDQAKATRQFPGWFQTLGNTLPDLSHADLRNMVAESEVKALLDLAGAKANMGENLAQSKKTADMFLDRVLDLLKGARAVKNGTILRKFRQLNVKQLKNLARSGKIEKGLANAWLEYWYGWRPLASDAYGLYELLNEQLTPSLILGARGRSQLSSDSLAFTGAVGYRPGLEISESVSVKAQTKLYATLDVSHVSRGFNRIGLINPLQLGWELIPFSFAIDWFVPIGSVLASLTATTGLQYVGGVTTVKFQRTVFAKTGADYIQGKVATGTVVTEGFIRSSMGNFPIPVPYTRSFYSGGDRIATVAALLTSLFR